MQNHLMLKKWQEDGRATIPFSVLSKATGSSCNLACRYCYYPQASATAGKMDDGVLASFIQRYIEQHPPYTKAINFVWQGGEPMLAGLAFYQQVIALQKRYAPKDVVITNSLQTNGTLLDDEWGAFFKAHHFVVGLSLDGDVALNDQHRIDKKGQGSHADVLRGLAILTKYQIAFNALVVVHGEMVDQAEAIYDYFYALGVQYIQFQPLTVGGRADGTNYHLTGQQWGDFLSTIYHHWHAQKHRGKLFVLNIENAYAQYFHGFSPTCVHAPVCGNQLALAQDGKLYACDHLMDATHYVGDLSREDDLLAPLYQAVNLTFGKVKSQRPECQTCRVKLLCEGGCPTHITSEGGNLLCEGYLRFFSLLLDEVAIFPRDASGIVQWRSSYAPLSTGGRAT